MVQYGKSLVIDLGDCDSSLFNRTDLKRFFQDLCKEIAMKPEKLVWWDDVGVKEEFKQIRPHTKGTSAVQFILTSSIVIHTLDILKCVYIDIFSCKDFEVLKTAQFCRDFFHCEVLHFQEVIRYQNEETKLG